MKKYDVNSMIGTWVKDELDIQNADQLLEALDYFDIEKAVVYHAEARSYSPIDGNRKLLELTALHDQLIPCFVLSPHYKYHSGWAELESIIAGNRVRFGKLYPKQHGYSLHNVLTHELMELAARQNMNLIFDFVEIADADGGVSASFESLVGKYPEINFIIVEPPYRLNMIWYSYLEHFPNFYLECSTLINWQAYEEIVSRFGSTNLLFGTNMPFNHAGPSITTLSYSDVSEEDKANIAYKNLLRLMGG